MRIAIASSRRARGTDDDEPLLLPALARAGATAAVVDWDDTTADWATYDLVVLRSTWDYTFHHQQFLAWTEHVAGVTRLRNAPPVVRWNSDKTYLTDLAAAGVPIVPTTVLRPGDPVELSADGEVVVKPTISAGSRDTARYRPTELDQAADHARRLLDDGRAVLVQPYQAAVDDAGETALLFLGGSFSHAARKGPLLRAGGAITDKLFALEQMSPRTATAVQLEVAERALAAAPVSPDELLYARVDVVPGPDGEPLLLELELVEPSVFLPQAPDGTADRFAAAIVAAAGA